MDKTYIAKKSDKKRQWYLADAKGEVLGRLASKIAVILRGKHKPQFSPHLDTGDGVIVINAAQIKVTGRKLKQKLYRRYSGYPGGLREVSLETMLAKKPGVVIRLAVRRMLPSGSLSRNILKRLKVYVDDKYPQGIQNLIGLKV